MGKYYLLFLFIGICLALFLRIKVEATSYTSPDSHYYLKVADNVVEGEGLKIPVTYPFDEETEETYLALWPAGYPLMIALVSVITNISSLLASKIVNVIFLGLIFLLLYHWDKEYAWFPALYFCSFGMLEVFSYTWTEGPFLFFVLYLCLLIYKFSNQQVNRYYFLKLAFCLIALFVLRYAGLIYFFFVGFYMLYFLRKKSTEPFLQLFLALLIASIFVGFYFYTNYLNTGYFTGGNRLIQDFSYSSFFGQLAQGVFNQFMIIRNYYFSGYTDYLFLILLLLQLGFLFFLYRSRKWLKGSFLAEKSLAATVCKAGIFYLPFIILLSYFLYFDRFNYRILAPFSMPLLVGLLMGITYPQNRKYFNKTRLIIAGFFLLSLVMNLPKVYLLEKLNSFW